MTCVMSNNIVLVAGFKEPTMRHEHIGFSLDNNLEKRRILYVPA
jgi:hypothetical protein